MRIGHGYDVHKFAENRPLILGGVIFLMNTDCLATATQMFFFTQ